MQKITDEEAVALLQQVMQIPTVGADEAKIADILAAKMQPLVDAGLATIERLPYAPGRDNLIIVAGPKDAATKLGIDGHMDVVAAGDSAKWTHAPFAAEIEDGILYGRGATDMKAGLIASFVALYNLLVSGVQLNSQLHFFATVGEEVDNYGARQLAAAGYNDGLTGLIVCEPSGPQIEPTTRGIIDYTVTATGKAAHSSTPEEGANAIAGLFAYNAAAAKLTAPLTAKAHAMLGHATHSITLINGGNQVNIIPKAASLRGNIRTTPLADNDDFTAALTAAVAEANTQVPGVKLSLSIDSTLPSVGSPADNRLVQTIQSVQQQFGKEELPVVGGTGICDAALLLTPGMDMAEFGPGNDTSHQTDECIALADFTAAIASYTKIFAQY
ncbi:succinyl-diaminopimelate desuccinylase [Lacticaseibacillus sharpeae JCM 1186 = DSM 20505]|uniref:Probable succinyl-diaminopimelate desuccinylase n=1 Tax=Lacticaseibacillus sharpeae JCM 1186 = DSM 20505 TaxID=1291052 RepID=A0A0R1ZSH1_9LACO|nr:ArgE/DapE family deacylase [Lacticaseibacillus sharpeae]KRM56148.1 succinyl-diaminopimelate desuccinylase [Lacticaseibacillus sharpeae JCM 1186 = DSM 20505]